MKQLIAFDLDGTLAGSKQPLDTAMGEALADLLDVVDVAVISGGDWPQFEKQVASRLPTRANIARLWLMPTDGERYLDAAAGLWCTNVGYGRKQRSEEHTSELQSLMRTSYA